MINYNKELNFYVFALEQMATQNFQDNVERGLNWLETMRDSNYQTTLPSINYSVYGNLFWLATQYNTGYFVVSVNPKKFQAVTYVGTKEMILSDAGELVDVMCQRLLLVLEKEYEDTKLRLLTK